METGVKHRVAIIGWGRLRPQYAEAYSIYPDIEIAARLADADAMVAA